MMKSNTYKGTMMLVVLLCFFLNAFAGNRSKKGTRSTQTAAAPDWGMAMKLSTNGLGAELVHDFTDGQRFFGRIGGTYLNMVQDVPYNMSGQTLNVNGNPRLGSVGVFADYQYSILRLTAGLSYMFTRVSVVGSFTEDMAVGDMVVPKEDIGEVRATLTANSMAPYMGIALGRAIPSRRVGFSMELGAFYQGDPDVEWSTTNMLEPSNDQGQVLEDNLQGWAWLPQLTFNLTFKIK